MIVNELHKNVRTVIRKAGLVISKPAKVSSLYDANVEGYLTSEYGDSVDVRFIPINDAHEGYRLPWLTPAQKITAISKPIQVAVDVLQAAGFATSIDYSGSITVRGKS